ncbi:peptide ligase PGM1-related protein [Streptomyces sp. NPDC060194]|uniref:preATP grasp domain-containing protein n=1 Tax=Streptomyces sp. NPDC060194 TaxID=3347069 RepID=UPI003669DEFA
MIPEHDGPGALVVLANFVSELAVDLGEEAVLRQWARQAPRKVWLARPGDVVVLPTPLAEPFLRYALERLGVPDGSVTVVTVPDTPHVPMAEALAVHGLLDPVRALVAERPDARLLPTALDAATVALAANLGTPLAGYEETGPSDATLAAVSELNTKSAFRHAAESLGMRLAPGRTCDGAQLPDVLRDMLDVHGRVVLKPDRSAGGHGLRFLAQGDDLAGQLPPPDSRWVVERHIAHGRAVSAQGYVSPKDEVGVAFDGEMRMVGGSYAGYRSPAGLPALAAAELARWTRALGRHLAAHGYRGPYSLDALHTDDGALYALESNVRRTATSTAHALVTRLTAPDGRPPEDRPAPAWSTGTVHVPRPLPFAAAVRGLVDAGLDVRPGGAEGVVLYTDALVDGTGRRYTALAADPARLADLEARLPAALTEA